MGKDLTQQFINDAETGERHLITAEKTEHAERLVFKIKYNLYDICESLKTLKVNRLYLYARRGDGGVGFETFNDFVADRLPWTVRQVQKYIAIADTCIGVRDEKKFFELSFSPLYELTRLPDETKEQMLSTGTLVLANGEEVSLDELAKMTSRDLMNELKSLRKQNRALTTTLEQHKLRAEKDIQILRKDNETFQRALDSLGADPEALSFYRGIRDSHAAMIVIQEAQSDMHRGFTRLKGLEIHDVETAHALRGFMDYVREMMNEYEAALQEFGMTGVSE